MLNSELTSNPENPLQGDPKIIKAETSGGPNPDQLPSEVSIAQLQGEIAQLQGEIAQLRGEIAQLQDQIFQFTCAIRILTSRLP